MIYCYSNTNIQHNESVEGLTLRENLPEEDPWHKWHMSEKASGTEADATVGQWQGQQNPSLCPSGSTVVIDPHYADPVLLSP